MAISHSPIFGYDPREHWKDRHNRRRQLAIEYEPHIRAWCEYRCVRFEHVAQNAVMRFKRDRAYAAWNYVHGWLRYCPDWKLSPSGPTKLKVNEAIELLGALERLWLASPEASGGG